MFKFADAFKGAPIVLAAVNMRAGIVMIGPLLPFISHQFGLTSFQLSFLTAIPVLCFAASGLLMKTISKAGSTNRVISLALTSLAIGLFFRAFGNIPALYIFSAVVGTSVAILNFTLPVWIKEKHEDHAGLLTGMYVTTMGIFAAVAIATAAPLAEHSKYSWRWAMLPWIIVSALSAAFWLVKYFPHASGAMKLPMLPFNKSLLKNRDAWGISIFFALQSMLFYGTASWFPTILESKGLALNTAGYFLAITGFIGSIVGLSAPHFISRIEDKRKILALVSLGITASFTGIVFSSGWHLFIWLAFMNTGLSIVFPTSLLLTVTRGSSPENTRSLSIMSQSFGYLLAAIAPVIFGLVFDITNNWNYALGIPVALSLVMAVNSFSAGAPKKI